MKPVLTDSGQVVVRTPSKLNLFLEVERKRPDGFHELDMIMEAIDLCDTLKAEKKPENISLDCNLPGIPTGSENTIIRAAELFFSESGIREGVHFSLEKKIPSGGGLGGASGNAICAIFALMKLFNVVLPEKKLYETACKLGSDMPFFLNGGLAQCRGRGEIVKTFGRAHPRRYLLVVPSFSLSTEEVYNNLTFPLTSPRFLDNIKIEEIEKKIIQKQLFFNRLEESAFKLKPELQYIVAEAEDKGVRIKLTGSGSCLFGLLHKKTESALYHNISCALTGVCKVQVVDNLLSW